MSGREGKRRRPRLHIGDRVRVRRTGRVGRVVDHYRSHWNGYLLAGAWSDWLVMFRNGAVLKYKRAELDLLA